MRPLIACLLLVAACESSSKPGAAPARDAAPAVVAVPADAAPSPPPGPPALLAITTDDRLAVLELRGGAVKEMASVSLASPRVLAWPRADGPIWVSVSVGDTEELGRVVGGAFEKVRAPGKGDLIDVITTDAGAVWLDRCLQWSEDNPDEEGCDRHGWFELPPGRGKAKKPPVPAPIPSVAAPADITIATAEVPISYTSVTVLECKDAAGTHRPSGDEHLAAPPTWQWLSTTPPIALLHIEWTGEGGGDPLIDSTQPHLLRGCTLSPDLVTIAVGPDGLWAEAVDDRFTIYRHGAPLVDVPASGLVFAGGTFTFP